MCWAEFVQYDCACYHGHRVFSGCPRGDAHGDCPALVLQGVVRLAGVCAPCRAKMRQEVAIELRNGTKGLAGVVKSAVTRVVIPADVRGMVHMAMV